MYLTLPLGFEGDDTVQGSGSNDKTYSQEEFDKHMAGMRRKYEEREAAHKKTQEQLAEQLKAAKEQPGLADDEREDMQKQIEALEQQYLTKQQKAEREATKKEKSLQEQIDSLTSDNSRWQSNYKNEVERNLIFLASKAHDAEDPEQMSRILGPDIEWKEIDSENGDGTTFEPRVKFSDHDKEGKPVQVEFTIDEAMARMKELPNRYGNLFKGQQKAGLGGGPNEGVAGGQQLTPEVLSKRPELLRKLMKEQPKKFGLK